MTYTDDTAPVWMKLTIIGGVLISLLLINFGCATRNPGDFSPDQIQAINRIKWK
ncbi:hypothetical protein Cp1R7AA1_055 [Mesorhizobium phage Cp1R7A-A1]|nr:hypothetical protein Cp1R7AA1_055 [Mesorhizobium phage Cp1R7A-A1]